LKVAANGKTVNRSDWSRPIARVLFGRSGSIIRVTSKAELESLLGQAKENKTAARILPKTEADDPETRALLETARAEARDRLQDAMELLSQTQKICQEETVPYTVIKSLDAVPDIGHDVDLLVGKNLQRVRSGLLRQFQCDAVTLTFCDRHAGKFSTFIRGFDSDFELYTRVSQLGEEYYPEEKVLERRGEENVLGSKTYLCSQEDRLLITCIHTMYRHGKIRLSDLKVAHDALNSSLDSKLVLSTVESAGIQGGFAVFLAILDRMGREMLEAEIVPVEFKEYSDRVLNRDKVLNLLSKRVNTRFPLKVPIRLVSVLFLYKAAFDLAHRRTGSSLRSALAPALLIIDKAIPLRLQKAISVRIW
jgi:hypothetical protein